MSVLVLEKFRLQLIQFLLCEQIDLRQAVIGKVARIKFILFDFAQEIIEGHGVSALPKTVFDVDFAEERDHILSLVLRGIQVLYPIKNNHHDDLVRHDACLLQEVLVALLDALDSGL